MDSNIASAGEKNWSAPGPGPWGLESSHWSMPMSVYMSEIFPKAMPEGFSRCAERYGLLIEGMRMVVIDHFLYIQIIPIGAPIDAKGPPPKWLFKLVLKLHPALRKRIKRSAQVLAERTWSLEIDEWNHSIKQDLVSRNQALQAVDLARLDNAELFDHLDECRDQLHHALVTHHSLTASTAVPLGRFLVKTASWTGLPDHQILGLLQGVSPSSIGITVELQRVQAALRSDSEAIDWLQSTDDAAKTLQRLLDAEGELGEAMRAYLDIIGNRLGTGYDVADRRVIEVPDVLLRGLASGLKHGHLVVDLQPKIDAVRHQVPAANQSEFDQLLADAQLTHEIRDQRIILGDSWATGLTRRALLEVGKRLTESGQIDEPEVAIDIRHAEIGALLNNDAGPNRELLTQRHQSRLNARIEDMPPFLGSEPGPPPPDDWLPGAAKEIMSGMGSFLNGNMGSPVAEISSATDDKTLSGLGASGGVIEGPARVITSPEQMNQIQQGDVLVVASTSPAFNVVLPLLSAIITERGGMLCHAAVVAREYGIPAVAGAPNALRRIVNGQQVRVDGTSGKVTLL
ncbi:MAG: hypothetical protein JKY89_10000 [Immundisolibacteraceae bacterium]|nr:hypothetical protein [Immundisolibacteraceae bacterium]